MGMKMDISSDLSTLRKSYVNVYDLLLVSTEYSQLPFCLI